LCILITVHSCGPGNIADSVLLYPAMLPQTEAKGRQKGYEGSRRSQIGPTPRKCLQRKGSIEKNVLKNIIN